MSPGSAPHYCEGVDKLTELSLVPFSSSGKAESHGTHHRGLVGRIKSERVAKMPGTQ